MKKRFFLIITAVLLLLTLSLFACKEKEHICVYGEWTLTPPSCTADGKRERSCSVCENKEIEVVPAVGHSYGEWVDHLSCTVEGKMERHCSVCGNKESEGLPATGHCFGEWTLNSGRVCVDKFVEERVCACGVR